MIYKRLSGQERVPAGGVWVNKHAKNSKDTGPSRRVFVCKLTNAFDAISHPAFSAAAFEAPRDIQARGVHVTVVGANFTLVHVWETRVRKKDMRKMRHELNSTSKVISEKTTI